MTTIAFQNNTIVVTIGPTGCGKTHLIREVIKPNLEQFGAQVRVISIDGKRELITQKPINRRDTDDFYFSSEGAYRLAKSELEIITDYPTNKFADVVIVDSSGLDEDFLSDIFAIANKNGYNVNVLVFDFKKYEHYMEHSTNKDRTRIQRETMYNKTLPFVRKVKTCKINNITKNFGDFSFEWIPRKNIQKISKYHSLTVVGSLLGDVNVANDFVQKQEKLQLQSKSSANSSNIDNYLPDVVVIMGNYLGEDLAMLELIDNLIFGQNNFVVCVLRGHMEIHLRDRIVSGNSGNKIINELFSKMSNEQLEMFDRIWNNSYNCVHVGKYELTTTLCERRKLHYLRDCHKELESELDIDKLVSDSFFVHICSYPLVSNISHKKSTILIGEDVSIMKISYDGRKNVTKYKVNKSRLYCDFNVISVSKRESLIKELDYNTANRYVLQRIETLTTNKINYISGTISPSDKNTTTGQLETIGTALGYYYKQKDENDSIPGTEQNTKQNLLSIQVKDMGSRFQFYYYTNDREASFGVSRNGYVAKLSREILNKVYDSLTPKLQRFEQFNGARLIIVDGELMPWSALGKSLIDTQFVKLHKAAKRELEILKSTGFEKLQNDLLTEFSQNEIEQDFCNMTGKELNSKYKKYETYKAIRRNRNFYVNCQTQEAGIDIFKEQIDIFGIDCEPYYKPFSILKFCYDDHEIINGIINATIGNVEMYEKLSDNQTLVVDLNDPFAENISKVTDFWNTVIVDGKFEGIIIKPDFVNPESAPCLKVRNSNYLHIIYGPDYLVRHKYESLIRKKNIRDKLAASIREFKIGLKMLEIPNTEIVGNKYMADLYYSFIDEEEKEKAYDKAL